MFSTTLVSWAPTDVLKNKKEREKEKKSSLTLKNEKLSFDSLKLQQTALSALRAHAINQRSTHWSFIL